MPNSSSAEASSVPVRFVRMDHGRGPRSGIRLDPMYRMRFDGKRRARATRTRVRVTDPESREERIVLEGPWITSVAWLSHDHLAVLTRGGTRTLSLSDPDVAQLSSLRNLDISSGSVTMECYSLLHVVNAARGGGLDFSVECSAESMESVMRGRLLVLRRNPPAPGTWGTLLLGFRRGELAVVGKLDRDIGPVFMQGNGAVSLDGYRLEDVQPALDSMKTSRILKVRDDLELDPPAPSFEDSPVLTGGAVRLEPVGIPEEGPEEDSDLRRKLGLKESDWIPESSSGPCFPVLRKCEGGYSVSLCMEGREISLSREVVAPHLHYSLTPDGECMLLSMQGGNVLVDTAEGSVTQAAGQPRGVQGAQILSSDRFFILSRLDTGHSQLDLWKLDSEGWSVVSSLPVEGADSLAFISDLDLIVLYSSLAPRRDSVALFILLEQEVHFRLAGRIAVTVKSVEQGSDAPTLQTREGIAYRIRIDQGHPSAAVPSVASKPEKAASHRPLYGYIDTRGDFVLPPVFSSAQGSSGTTVAAALPPHGFFSLLTVEGRTLLPAQASSIDLAYEGFRRVAFFERPGEEVPPGAGWGMIGEDGRWLLPPNLPMISSFSRGRAVVRFSEGDENWIDLRGERLSAESFSACGDFHEGRASVMKGGLCGYADESGRVVIDTGYSVALDFSCGAAGVQRRDGKWLCIDRDGNVLAGPFDEFYPHYQGFAAVRKGDSWRYIDTRGNDPFGMVFQKAYNFTSGLGVVVRKGRWGFISRDGRMISNPEWDGAYSPSGGLGVYSQGGHYGLVDSGGKVLTDPLFSSIRPFSQDLAAVRTEEGYGYVNCGGAWVIQPRFFDAWNFSCGLAPVQEREGGPWGYIDETGDWAVPPSFRSCFVFSRGLAVVSPL